MSAPRHGRVLAGALLLACGTGALSQNLSLTERAALWWTAPGTSGGPGVNGHAVAAEPPAALALDGDLARLSLFVVYAPAPGGAEELIWTLGDEAAPAAVLTTHRLADLRRRGYRNFADTLPAPARLHSYYARRDSLRGRLRFGGPPPSGLPVRAFSGGLLEVIAFRAVLSPEERRRVESYLAIKYGLTLRADYRNRAGDTTFPIADGAYEARVFGLGRDDFFALAQRTSHSVYAGDLLSVSTDAPLAPGATVLVGDDGGPLQIAPPRGPAPPALARTWRSVATAWPAADAPLTLHFDTARVDYRASAVHYWWLRQDDGERQYLRRARGVDSLGRLSFELPVPDGTFSFVYAPGLIPVVAEALPRCAGGREGRLTVRAVGGAFPVSVAVADGRGHVLHQATLSHPDDVQAFDLPPGAYALHLADARGEVYTADWFFAAEDAPAHDLGDAYVLPKGAPLALRATDAPDVTASWWTADGEALGTGPERSLSDPGDYRLRLERDGCVREHHFRVERAVSGSDNVADLRVFPNPTADGVFALDAQLRVPAEGHVRVHDATGRLLYEARLPEAQRHRWSGRVAQAGTYLISVNGEGRRLIRAR